MEIMQGVKILTLFKQHYLNGYPKNLDCEYSCLGYYDGMDIVDVEEGDSQLFVEKSNSMISNIWYQIAKKVRNMNGKYSQQNIGIFRKADARESEFWDKKKRKIFMSVCFVQLKKWEQAQMITEEIEKSSSSEVEIIVYNTFDNADLVVFFQGNSYKQLLDRIAAWEMSEEFAYIHSINGVLEKSLYNAQEHGGDIVDCAGNPLINDAVCELQMDIVATEKDFERKLWSLFSRWNADLSSRWNRESALKNYHDITCSHVSGHGNYTFLWRNTDMQSVLYLFLPEGIGTHRNGLFGKAIYNMETQIRLKQETINVEEESVRKYIEETIAKKMDDTNITSWCSVQIDKYVRYMDNSWSVQDEGFYSYCRAMIQTLNMLAQFEKFELSNRIFHIIYPAFQLFSEQLDEVYNPQNTEQIRETIKDFSEAVNTIVYHAIHTDQIFLMIPGYSGTSFSIPTKLSLFYLWYLERISKILNDDHYKYQFFLTPVMETRPYTNTIEFGLPPEDRLISVKVSQRSLYMPRMLLIILTHETAHYVGQTYRNRKSRLEYIIRTLAYLIAEGIYPHFQLETQGEINKQIDLISYIMQAIKRYLDLHLKGNSSADKYHVSYVKPFLKEACLLVLADENREISNILRQETECVQTFSERLANMEVVQKKADSGDKRRVQLLGDERFLEIVEQLIGLYQEIFADIVAKELLQFDQEDYNIAFDISEGCKITNTDRHEAVRKKVVMNEPTQGAFYQIQPTKGDMSHVVDYWTHLEVVEKYMIQYAEQCTRDLKTYLETDEEKGTMLNQIRDIMQMFSTNKESWEHIFKTIIEKAGEYSDEVKIMIKDN